MIISSTFKKQRKISKLPWRCRCCCQMRRLGLLVAFTAMIIRVILIKAVALFLITLQGLIFENDET